MTEELAPADKTLEPPTSEGFTELQLKFIQEIVADPNLNRSRAARRAGYESTRCHQMGYQNWNNVRIRTEINRRLVEARKDWKIAVDQRYVVERIKRTIDRCMQAVPVLDDKGRETGTFTFNAAGALKGLDMLARFGGMYEEAGSTPPNGAPGGTPGTVINLQVILPMVRAALDELKKGNAPTGPVVIQQPEAGETGETAGEPGPESLADYLKTKGA